MFLKAPTVGDEGSGIAVNDVLGDDDFRASSEKLFEIHQLGVRAQLGELVWAKVSRFKSVTQLVHLTN